MKALVIAAAVAVGLSMSACATQDQHWETGCKVTDKQILTDVSGSNGSTSTTRTKRLSTSCGAFNVEDAWEAGSFNSYDLWSKLEVGKTYDLKVGGIRNGFFSMFQTVLEVKESNG
ncbi:secreted protein [Mycobacterium phage DyoEdafos]|uniref:Lipoprotein n=1 Tax=Mycobacterium phage DyoEdafos TaxID=2599860 RepID=A0A5J6TI66_9CAUD|nr:secreted protein [Mycobacterium phage DyoEdafos]QFG10286.1 hypothetical protein SEA_DYOEDAFOS_57 [Mycobacterium phage DyoEdafos]